MRVVISSCIALLCLFASFVDSSAQNRFIPFTYNESLSVAHKSVDGKPRLYLNVDERLFSGSDVSVGDVFLFEHESVEYEFTVKKVVSYRPDTYTYVANSGLNYFYFTVGNDAAIGAIHMPDIRYEAVVIYDSALKSSYMQEHDHDDELGCGIHLIQDQLLDQSGAHIERIRVSGSVEIGDSMQSVDDETTVKLMIAYANGAESWMMSFGGVDNVINQAMALSQEALDASDTKVILDLVHVTHIQHQESGIGGSVLLNQLRNPSDGIMDGIHSLRNIFEADIVSLLAFINDVGGVGYLPSSPEGDDRLGFNVNRVQQVASTYVLIHEIGHNFGNQHSRNQASNAAGFYGGVFPYSTGWRWIGDDNVSYASVMTYENSPLDGVNSIRTPHFSNPSISYRGVPTGTSSALNMYGPADNARSMREMKDVIASYRPRDLANDQLEIEAVSPAWGARGTNVVVVFRGRNFNNISNISWLCPSNGAMQATAATINNPSQLTVNWNISFGAAPGTCEIRLWTGAVNSSSSVSTQFTITEFPIETPTVITTTVNNVDHSSAVVSGSVSFDGGAPVTSRGVCLATTPNPTLDDICVSSGAGDGSFSTELFGLTPATAFNVRAYAVNLAGIAYGQQLSFSTLMGTNLGSDTDKPLEFRLDQNYPNPFNPSTQISFSLPVGVHVDLAVYDMMGRRVSQLVDAFTAAGTHRVTFDAATLPSGIYMYVIKAGGMMASNKMTLIK